MAKKKKGNMRNIQPGATVQFLNFLTPDHILKGKYNTGNNELDITDVPANLNSVITLGQGGGGSDLIDVTITNSAESTGDITVGCVLVDLEDPDNTVYYSDNVNISIGETKTLKIVKNVLLSPLYVYHQDENNYCDLVSGDCVITDTGDVYFTANGQEAIFKAVYE